MMNLRKWSAIAALALAATLLFALPAAAQDKGKEKGKDKAADAKPAPAADAKPAPSGGSTATASGGYKIGVVDIEQVVENYAKKKRLMDELKVKVDAGQTEIDSMTNELDKLQKEAETTKDTISDADRSAKQTKMRTLVTDIKSMREKKQGEIDQREAEIKAEVFGDVNKAIQQIAESENYHLVLNSRVNSSVLYASPTIDITTKVQTQLGAGK